MTIAYMPRKANKLVIAPGQTLGALLTANQLADKLDIVALYNWGTKIPAEINRALVELVGCSRIDVDPLKSKLDPRLGGGEIYKPVPWTPKLAVEKTYLVKLKKRLPVTAVAITELTLFFDPSPVGGAAALPDKCTARCRFEGVLSRANRRDFEVHASAYYELVKHGAGGNAIEVEKPCGTTKKDVLSDTLIFHQTREGAPGMEPFEWDGTSQATEGVLKTPMTINSHCAPYVVLIRYYQDDADKNTRIKLKPFYPRWKPTGANTLELLDESLVVEWTRHGNEASLAKLKAGQLEVRDKDNKLIFFTPLTAKQIVDGRYNLLAGPKPWNKLNVERAKMPYRVQLQAHSDADEDKGLALATMPTQVPAYVYDQVQLIGFNVRNDVVAPNTGAYLGDADPDTDIAERCDVMIEAIQTARKSANTAENILKVFVAPEFFFRGAGGAYPFEKIQSIFGKLAVETDQHKYVNWLFVFGTAIARLKHEDIDTPNTAIVHKGVFHRVQVVAIDAENKRVTVAATQELRLGGILRQGDNKCTIKSVLPPHEVAGRYNVEVSDAGVLQVGVAEWLEQFTGAQLDVHPNGNQSVIKARSSVFARIPLPLGKVIIGGVSWKAMTGANKRDITNVEHIGEFYQLTLSAPLLFCAKTSVIELVEPVASEIFNVALVQRGWRAPSLGDRTLRELVVYKEYISHIDFSKLDDEAFFNDASGVNRKVWLDNTQDQPILPTDGSQDIGGARPNVLRAAANAVGTEMNDSGLGGGCVFTMHGITFGLEVCLDHGNQRLWNFYHGANKQARSGDSQVQVQLIPSWGMTIGSCPSGSEVTTVVNGLVFNVDGSRMQSVARFNDGKMLCETHTYEPAPLLEPPLDPGLLHCRLCAQAGAVRDEPYCDNHGYVPYNYANFNGNYWCAYCGQQCRPPNWCFSHNGIANNIYHHVTVGDVCGCETYRKPLKRLGTPLPEPVKFDVPLSDNPHYFKWPGNVQVFEVMPLPPPDVVPPLPP